MIKKQQPFHKNERAVLTINQANKVNTSYYQIYFCTNPLSFTLNLMEVDEPSVLEACPSRD
jgi:hypothetical protein